MDIEQRLEALEEELVQLKKKKKDTWDKIAIASTVLIPLSIAGVGGAYSFFSQRADTRAAEIRAAAESKINQAELISRYFEPLTGKDPQQREIAIESLLVAAPDYGPILVRVSSRLTTDQEAAIIANKALSQRRDSLIRQMFGQDKLTRRNAYTQLLSSWGNDEAIVGALIEYGEEHIEHEDGIYNVLVLLSHLQKEIVIKNQAVIIEFAELVEGNGKNTKKRADILRERVQK